MTDQRLTELQLAIMNVLWARKEATAGEVREALLPERKLAPTTISTLLSRMEKKGVVAHRKAGRQFVYSPVVEANEMRRTVVSDLTDAADQLFGGDIADVVTHLLSSRDVDADDLARVRELIEAKEAELRKKGK